MLVQASDLVAAAGDPFGIPAPWRLGSGGCEVRLGVQVRYKWGSHSLELKRYTQFAQV